MRSIVQAGTKVLRDFVGSEKAMASFVVLIAATVFTLRGMLSVEEWKEMSLWILGIYVGGKTVQGAAHALKNGNHHDEEPSAENEKKPEKDAA